jgi:hypothetical protein
MTMRLTQLSAKGDWPALQAADRQLAVLLPKLIAQGEWLPVERQALRDLRGAHDGVREYCAREAARVSVRLLQMRECRTGWLAYALNEAWERNGT